jgi:hypothetical protein
MEKQHFAKEYLMNQPIIRADSFILKAKAICIHLVRHHGSGTVWWTSADAALRYLKKLQIQRLGDGRGDA